jgi:serine/threonine-protein phosphatase 5
MTAAEAAPAPAAAAPELLPIKLPAVATVEWVLEVQRRLNTATEAGADAATAALPRAVAVALFDRAERLLRAEPPLLELSPSAVAGDEVVVVGDTHGQFHDVLRLLEVAGPPGGARTYVFNGDFVDRGAWGLETLALLAAWKLALPAHVRLLRGNHESATCTLLYGFKGELAAKYGRGGWKPVYAACKRLFAALSLAALVARATLVLHGGLFRAQPARGGGKSKRKREEAVLGTLQDLRRASKGGLDPGGLGAARLASDVMWSDPVRELGLAENTARGIGLVFGPDVTQAFLAANGLQLILRSHEGPDAREDRTDMGDMLEGWTLDHDTPAGRLMTVFSAPDYPQFVAAAAARYGNKGAVAVLRGPGYATPSMAQYGAAPRPPATPFYDLGVADSDEEFELAADDASGMTDVRAADAAAAAAAAAGEEEEEGAEAAVEQPVAGGEEAAAPAPAAEEEEEEEAKPADAAPPTAGEAEAEAVEPADADEAPPPAAGEGAAELAGVVPAGAGEAPPPS